MYIGKRDINTSELENTSQKKIVHFEASGSDENLYR